MTRVPPDPGSTAATGPVVLVVEREGQGRDLEAHYLRQAGFQVEMTPDGAAAWDLVQRRPPDLVVTELLVPRLDGLALCHRIKTSPATQEILVLIVSMLAAASRSRDAGADAFLLKPISQERIDGVVARLFPRMRANVEERA